MADERVSQDVNSQIDRVGETAQNAALDVGKKGAKALAKGAKKAGGKAIKTAGKAMVKAGAAMIKSLISLLPLIWPILVAIIVIIILIFIYNMVYYNFRIGSGSFQNENDHFFADVQYDDFGNIIEIDTTYESDLAALFYTRYAQQSYYYMIDDDLTLKQAGTQSETVKDIDGRESLFLLNPQLLSVLDQELNGDYKMPEQFVKPVYHTCEKTDGKVSCSLNKLTDDAGNLTVESTKYGNIENKEDYKSQIIYERTDGKIKGTWDWGLAPIIHYSSFTESSYVPKINVSEVTIIRDGEEVKVNPIDLTDAEKIKFGYDKVITEVNNAKNIKRGNSKYDLNNQIPANKKIYVIDNVITFAGEITNTTKEEDVVTGNLTTILNHDYEEETVASEEMYANQSILKTVYGPNGQVYNNVKIFSFASRTTTGTVYEPTWEDTMKIGEICRAESTNQYDFQECLERKKQELIEEKTTTETVNGANIDGRFVQGAKSQFKVTYMKKYSLPYVVEGTIYTNTLVYSEQNPDTTKLSETSYLMDYIENYSAFAEIDMTNKVRYGCYKIDSTLSGAVSNSYLNSLENWNNLGLSNKQILEIIDNGTLEKVSEVYEPLECPNNQIALRLDGGEMTSFYFGQTTNLQKILGASILGYDLTEDSDGVFEKVETENIKTEPGEIEEKESETLAVSTIKINDKTIKNIVKDTADKYRLDENLLLAIITAQTKGSFNTSNIEEGCLKNANGCGALKIKYDSNTVSYMDYVKEKKSSLILTDVDYSDAIQSIDALGAILQSYLEEYDFNYLVAIQALDYGKTAMDKVIGTAAFNEGYSIIDSDTSALYPLNDITKIEWAYYRKYVLDMFEPSNKTTTPSDFEILEKILSYIGKGYKVRVWNSKNNSYISKSWSVFKSKANSYIMGSAAVEFTNKAIQVYELNKTNFEKTWDILFLGQKNYNEAVYDLESDNPTNNPKYGLYVEGNAQTEELSSKIIQLIFAYYDGKDIEEYEEMTLADYKVRLVNMFQIGNRYAYDKNYDISSLIPTGDIYKPADSFEIIRGYGHAIDKETEQRGYFDDIELLVEPSSKIYSISSGIVETVQKNQNNKYTITTSHTGYIYNQETGVPEKESTTMIIYMNLDSATVKRGDEIGGGQLLGETNADTERIQIKIVQDDVVLNSEAIMNYIMVKHDMVSVHFGKVANYSDNWIAPVVERFHLNDGTWESTFGGGRIHMGVDIGFTNSEQEYGQKLVAPFSGTVVYTHDGCPKGYIGSKCGGALGNAVILAGEVDGATHIVMFMHMLKNTISVSQGQAVQQGTYLGGAGSSGNSTGLHLHYEIVHMANYSVDDVINYYKSTSDFLFTNGYGYQGMKDAGAYICTATRQDFCRIRPEEKYGWIYDHGKTSYEPNITTPR